MSFNNSLKYKIVGNGSVVLLFSDESTREKALESFSNDDIYIVKESVDQGVNICSASIGFKNDISVCGDLDSINELIQELKDKIHNKLFSGVMDKIGQFILVVGFNDIYTDIKKIEIIEMGAGNE